MKKSVSATCVASVIIRSNLVQYRNFSVHIFTTQLTLTPAGEGGSCPPPTRNLKKKYVICYRPTKYPKNFAHAFGARHTYPIFQPETSQKRKFSLAPQTLRKNQSIFCTARRKRVNFLKCWWFCPPLENFLRAPHGSL